MTSEFVRRADLVKALREDAASVQARRYSDDVQRFPWATPQEHGAITAGYVEVATAIAAEVESGAFPPATEPEGERLEWSGDGERRFAKKSGTAGLRFYAEVAADGVARLSGRYAPSELREIADKAEEVARGE